MMTCQTRGQRRKACRLKDCQRDGQTNIQEPRNKGESAQSGRHRRTSNKRDSNELRNRDSDARASRVKETKGQRENRIKTTWMDRRRIGYE